MMIRPSSKMFLVAVAFFCFSAISWVNYTHGMLPTSVTTTNSALVVRWVFPFLGLVSVVCGLLFRSIEKMNRNRQQLTTALKAR